MNPHYHCLLSIWILTVFCCAAVLTAENAVPTQIPQFELHDPGKARFDDEALKLHGAIVIVTIPNVKHARYQDQWGRWLTQKGWSEQHPRFFFIEDLSQAQPVRERALLELEQRHKAGEQPFLLLDETGEVRRKFGVQNDETVLFVVDRNGHIVRRAAGAPSLQEASEILKIVKTMLPAATQSLEP